MNKPKKGFKQQLQILSCIARILSVTVIVSIFIFIALRYYGVAISIPIFDRNLLNVLNTDLVLLLRSTFSKVPQTHSTTKFPQQHESIKRVALLRPFSTRENSGSLTVLFAIKIIVSTDIIVVTWSRGSVMQK